MYLFPLVDNIRKLLEKSAEILPVIFIGSITSTKEKCDFSDRIRGRMCGIL